jgi:hypothetical protein
MPVYYVISALYIDTYYYMYILSFGSKSIRSEKGLSWTLPPTKNCLLSIP